LERVDGLLDDLVKPLAALVLGRERVQDWPGDEL
jgi:hypothetical protein